LRVVLEEVRVELRRTLKRQKDELGFNLAGLRVLGRRAREAGESGFVDGEEDGVGEGVLEKAGTKGKKRAFVNIA